MAMISTGDGDDLLDFSNRLETEDQEDTRLLYTPEGSMDADDGHLSVSAAGSTDTLATDVTISSEKLDPARGMPWKDKKSRPSRTVKQVQEVNTFIEDTNKLLVDYESSIREAIKNDVTTDFTVAVWTYWGSVFFVWTVYTTIEWHKEVFEHELDFYTVTKDNLAEKLRKFYCEATPKQNSHSEKVLPAHQANEYHRNTMTDIKCDKSHNESASDE
ncbi:hypothetical protein MAR_016514 [Mya arenaria]|uniref:PiggyBac transposable element-derived protein domain-containing protein n=1 Tax=Mya arenaria TaxID=6604 RepID=A0ABY7FK16_MYAAR|nr:hypothetical protein MAR_016514 [Mya arenaria]